MSDKDVDVDAAMDAKVELVLRSTRVVTPDGTRAASVAVSGGRIAAV